MKLTGTAIATIFILSALVSGAWAIPALPCDFWGNVMINGQPATAGTTITALIDDEVRGEITTTEAGHYGDYTEFMEKLVVEGSDEDAGKTIRFTVAGVYAGQTATFISGDARNIDLSITTGGGGSSSGSSSSGSSSYVPAQTTTTPTTEPTVEPGFSPAPSMDMVTSQTAAIPQTSVPGKENTAPDSGADSSVPWTAIAGVSGLIVVVGGVYFWWNGKNQP